MSREIKAVVVMHFDETGNLSVQIADPDGEVVVLTVDDRCPRDRVFEHTSRHDPAAVLALAPRPWGHKDDDMGRSVETRLHHAEHGLKVVK